MSLSALPTVPATQNGAGTPPPVTPQPSAADKPSAPARVEGEVFDRDAALAEAMKVLEGGESAEGDAQAQPAEPPPGEPSEEEAAAKKKEPPKDLTQDKLSKGFAKLHAQEERLNERYQAWQTEQAQTKAEVEAYRKERADYDAKRQAARQNPLLALEEAGWSVDQFVKFVMQDGKVPPEVLAKQLEEQHKSELEKTRKDIEELRNQRQREQDLQYAAEFDRQVATRVEAIVGKDDSFLPEASASYPMFVRVIETFGRDEVLADVKTALLKHHEQTGQVVDPARAVKYLDEAYRKRFPKLAASLGGNPVQAGAVQTANPGAAKPRQLTAGDVSEVGAASDEDWHPSKRDELLAKATRQFAGS